MSESCHQPDTPDKTHARADMTHADKEELIRLRKRPGWIRVPAHEVIEPTQIPAEASSLGQHSTAPPGATSGRSAEI